MSPRLIECVQGDEAWHKAHLGILTASVMGTALAGGEGKTRGELMRKLAGERVTGVVRESYRNGAMDRGNAMEAEARTFYAMMENVDVEQVGFVVNDGLISGRTVGASPDGFVGDKGAVEFKTEAPHLLIARWEGNASGAEHVMQCQTVLWVSEREWIDLGIYYTRMPMWKRRIYRDRNKITQIETGARQFYDELDSMVERVKRYGT